jgi:pyridoxine 4-dehydrogenase
MIKAALDAGANFLNGSEFYGPSLHDNSLTLLNQYFQKYPEDADK